VPVVGSEDLHPVAAALDPGGADEDRPQRLVADPGDRQVGLEALQLTAEGVAPGAGVEESEVLGGADDQAGAGAEDRPAGLVVGAERRLQAGRGDALDDRRALAAGDDEPVEALQLGGRADLAYFGAELAQGAGVRPEVTLQR
jgi:hypothetical protein